MVRDELDIIGYTLPRMAAQLDHVLVADNLSVDGTTDLLHAIAERMGNITIINDEEPAYLQSEKITKLAFQAREDGATWVVPFDADEVWTPFSGHLADDLRDLTEADCVEVDLYDHVATNIDDHECSDPIERIRWRRAAPSALPKVACRPLPGFVIEQGNHGVRYPGPFSTARIDCKIHHYPYRSPGQMARKARNGAAAYAAAGDALSETTGQHWRDYGRLLETGGEESIREVFFTWFYANMPDAEGLVDDLCPVPMPDGKG